MENKSGDRNQNRCIPGQLLAEKVELFVQYAHQAEYSIRENYGRGHIPHDLCGDGWSDEFAEAYNSIREDLRPFFREESHMGPLLSAYMWKPVTSECPVQAWMFLLNPADMAFGEPGYLESDEYQAIKTEALNILRKIANPPRENILTDTERRLVVATTSTPQTAQKLAIKANCEYGTARKYLPGLCRRGFVIKAPKNGYYRLD